MLTRGNHVSDNSRRFVSYSNNKNRIKRQRPINQNYKLPVIVRLLMMLFVDEIAPSKFVQVSLPLQYYSSFKTT